LMSAGCDFEERMPIEMATLNQTQPLGKEKTLESTVHFDIGSIEISGEKQKDPILLRLGIQQAGFSPKFATTHLLAEQRADFISAFRVRINWAFLHRD